MAELFGKDFRYVYEKVGCSIMRKGDYLQRLEQLLYNIPAEDREEALQFYKDYLEDAGPEAEEEVLRSLGTPEELAESIRKALYGDNAEGDYTRVYKDVPGTYRAPFSTGGRFSGAEAFGGADGQGNHNSGAYAGEQYWDKQGENTYTAGSKAQAGKQRKGRLTAGQWIIFIILCLCAAPVIVPVFGTVLGVVLAVVGVLLGVLLALGLGGIALVIAAIVLIVVALVKLIFSPFSSLIMVGGGFLMVGLGLIGIAFATWIVCKILPAIFAGITRLFSGILRGR